MILTLDARKEHYIASLKGTKFSGFVIETDCQNKSRKDIRAITVSSKVRETDYLSWL